MSRGREAHKKELGKMIRKKNHIVRNISVIFL
jgi:hypothetical protein